MAGIDLEGAQVAWLPDRFAPWFSSNSPACQRNVGDCRYVSVRTPATWGAAECGAFGQLGALLVAVVAGLLVWLPVRQGSAHREDQTRHRGAGSASTFGIGRTSSGTRERPGPIPGAGRNQGTWRAR